MAWIFRQRTAETQKVEDMSAVVLCSVCLFHGINSRRRAWRLEKQKR